MASLQDLLEFIRDNRQRASTGGAHKCRKPIRSWRTKRDLRKETRHKPEVVSIEELLSCYIASPQQIILYAKGLGWLTRKKNIDEILLRAVVIVHEIGH